MQSTLQPSRNALQDRLLLQLAGRREGESGRNPSPRQRNYHPMRPDFIIVSTSTTTSHMYPANSLPDLADAKWPCWARRWFLSGFLSPRHLVSFGVPVDSPHIHFLLAQGLHFRILFVTLRLPTYLLVGTDDVPDNYRRAPQRHMRLPTRASRPQRP